MQKQKERARNAAAIETGDWVVLKEGESKFVGYDLFECEAEILRYRKIKQKNKELFQIVLDQTPFYAEMGGQVGDTGWLIADDEKLDVVDTKRENNLPVHFVTRLPKDVTVTFTAKINEKKRIQCECNHSATHLLHEALREVLGTHVEQKGSYVSPEALRFDFSHFQKVTDEEIRQVEDHTGCRDMCTTAQLDRRTVFNDTYFLTILLTEQCHSTQSLRLGYRHIAMLFQRIVGTNLFAYQLFYLADFFVGHFLEMPVYAVSKP